MASDDRDAPQREDSPHHGRVLGDTLRAQQGVAVFERIQARHPPVDQRHRDGAQEQWLETVWPGTSLLHRPGKRPHSLRLLLAPG